MSAQAIRKISAKTVVGDVKKLVVSDKIKNGQEIMRVIGIADSVRTGTTTYGEFTGAQGDFEATNMLTGEVFTAPEFFGDSKVMAGLTSRLKGEGVTGVEIALSICIEVNSDLPTGYAYVSKPIMQNAVNRLADLRQRLAELPAPEAATTKAKSK